MTYRLRLARNGLKLKVSTRIPAQLVGGTGVSITKANGVYTFDVDEDEIESIATLAAEAAVEIGVNVQGYDADLAALAANSTDGLWTHTGAGTGSARTITGTANQITVTNGNGVSGNPTLSIPSAAALPGAPTTTTASANDNSTKIATTAYVQTQIATQAPRSYLTGLTLSTAGSSATFGIAAGSAVNSTNVSMMTLASAYTKTTSSWALGTATGSLDTGAIANSTWYHVFLIQRPDTGVVDVLTSLSASAPTMPTSYTLFRRIGSMKTNGSAQWTLFTQVGDDFLWSVPPQDVTSTVGTTADLITLTVPTGVQVNAQIFGLTQNASGNIFWAITSPDQTDTLPAAGFFCGMTIGAASNTPYSMVVRTNTSAQVRRRASAATTTIYINTFGWADRRGRDS